MLQRILSLLRNGRARTSSHMIKTDEGIRDGWGTTVGNGIEGWAPGADFVHTDGATKSTLNYKNTGTKTTAIWTACPVGLGSTASGAGASLLGIEDSDALLDGADGEAALAELARGTGVHPDDTIVFMDDFLASDLYALGLVPAGWTVIDTSSAGTPTINESADCHGGAVELTCDNTDELQTIGIDFNDELLFDVDSLISFECRFRAPTQAATEEIVIGMISDQNDAPASLTEGAWISVDGGQDIDCESDDGTVRNDGKDSGVNLGNDVWCNVKILFAAGAAATFYLDVTGLGAYTQVQAATAFTLSNYAAGLQPVAFLTKSGGATTPNLDIDFIKIVATRA